MQESVDQISDNIGLGQRLKWLLGFRVIFASVLFLATLIWRPGGERSLFGPSFIGVFVLVSAQLLAAIGFFFLNKKETIQRVWGFALVQIIWDLFFTTAFVSITGGLDSDYKPLYWLTIMNAAILLFRTGAFIAAAFSGFMYGILLNLQYFGFVIPLFNTGIFENTPLPEDRIWRSISLQTFWFFVIAYLFGSLSNYLRQTETILKEKSANLEDLEALMGRIVDSLTSGLVTLDKSDQVVFWSRAAEWITGISFENVRGKNILDIFPKASDLMKQGSTQNLKERNLWRWEMEYTRKGGESQILGFSASPLQQSGQAEPGTLIIFQDLTQFRAMEDQVKRADRLAVIGEMAARMAHEIRNPLTSMSGSIEVLRKDLELKDRDKKLMDIVIRETDRLNLLLTEFLQFARPTELHFEQVHMSQLIQETTELFSKSHGRTGVRVNVKMNDEVYVYGDARQLNQLFWNLLKNASEAMPQGGLIQIHAKKDSNKNVIIEVIDQGTGISPEVRSKIFLPFYTTKPKGTGLGLAVVRRIAEDHHGSIEVVSEEGKGTTFRIQLPLEKVNGLMMEQTANG